MVNHNVWLPYTQMKTHFPSLEVCHTKGSEIFLKDDRALVDGVSSWWTACHGYLPDAIIQAMHQQLDTLSHVMLGGLIHQPALTLSSQLTSLLPEPLQHVFYSESGSIAVEVALKMVLQYWINQNKPQRKRFVYFEHAYHGDTFFTMSLCCPLEGMHKLFGDILPKQYCQPIPTNQQQWSNYQQFLRKHQSSIAGIIIEPLIQGAGGMKCHPPETLHKLTCMAQALDIPVIFDEIFTGFGRTGTLFALDQIPACPDIITLGKALTAGVTPLAATIASSQIYEQFLSDDPDKALMHGPTFMGHALGCQAAIASLEIFKTQPRLQQVKQIESFLINQLQGFSHPQVKAIRVKGAMGVIELNNMLNAKQLSQLRSFFIEKGTWIRPFANIIYITPALNMSHDHLKLLVVSMKQGVEALD